MSGFSKTGGEGNWKAINRRKGSPNVKNGNSAEIHRLTPIPNPIFTRITHRCRYHPSKGGAEKIPPALAYMSGMNICNSNKQSYFGAAVFSCRCRRWSWDLQSPPILIPILKHTNPPSSGPLPYLEFPPGIIFLPSRGRLDRCPQNLFHGRDKRMRSTLRSNQQITIMEELLLLSPKSSHLMIQDQNPNRKRENPNLNSWESQNLKEGNW